MKKQRYNVSEVAELLLQEMESFKASAERLKSTTVKIDEKSLEEFRSLVEKQEQIEKEADKKRSAFLDKIKGFEEKRSNRMPNGLLYAIIVLFVAIMAFSAYALNQYENLNYIKGNVELNEQKGGQ